MKGAIPETLSPKKAAKAHESYLQALVDSFPALATSSETVRAVSLAGGSEAPGVQLSALRGDVGVLLITDHRVYFAGRKRRLAFEAALTDIMNVRWTGSSSDRRGALYFELPSGSVELRLVAKEAADLLVSLETGLDPPTGPPVATFGRLELYADRFVSPDRVFRLHPEVRAEVQTAGDLAATRGRNIAAGLAGTAIFGPLGMLLGSAKTEIRDLRELYLLVEGTGWAYGTNVNPTLGLQIRQFAQQINVAARKLAPPSKSGPSDDRLDRLHKLGELKAAGVLTDAEFEAEKARVLSEH